MIETFTKIHEAIQYTGNNVQDVLNFVGPIEEDFNLEHLYHISISDKRLRTGHYWVVVVPGDWIVKDNYYRYFGTYIGDHFYSFSDDDFKNIFK